MSRAPKQLSIDLPSDPVAAGQARAHVRGALRSWSRPVVEDASLMVTEMVTNAVEHGGPPVRLGVSVHASQARVTVHDAIPLLPRRVHLDLGAEHGRGLVLVAALADRWGAELVPADGKRVWFDVSDRLSTA